jgi:hypothetical protein
MNVGSSFQIPIRKTFRLNLPVSVSAMYDKIKTWRASPSPSQGGDVKLPDTPDTTALTHIAASVELHF